VAPQDDADIGVIKCNYDSPEHAMAIIVSLSLTLMIADADADDQNHTPHTSNKHREDGITAIKMDAGYAQHFYCRRGLYHIYT